MEKTPILISDLLIVIHRVIIKEQKANEVILKELSAIDEKISTGVLKDYDVSNDVFWKSMMNKIKQQ
jgi:hypothetical protein